MESSDQTSASQYGPRSRLPVNKPEGLNGAGNGAAAEEEVLSVIGTGILVTGNIEAEVDLHIEGAVVGDVRCATLILGERGTVTGSIFAERVRVSGTVEGGIETTDLAIEASAKVKGDVTYSRIRIANGGVIAGTMTHKPLDETARLALVESEPAKAARVHYIE